MKRRSIFVDVQKILYAMPFQVCVHFSEDSMKWISGPSGQKRTVFALGGPTIESKTSAYRMLIHIGRHGRFDF